MTSPYTNFGYNIWRHFYNYYSGRASTIKHIASAFKKNWSYCIKDRLICFSVLNQKSARSQEAEEIKLRNATWNVNVGHQIFRFFLRILLVQYCSEVRDILNTIIVLECKFHNTTASHKIRTE